mmetsp:Transcript_33599/g.81403  ORF Transcript_33599/g.81403 Transcript_33599/m.81403 type:complete len:643 (+) Transcript_33599:39-1967(+)
MGSTIASFCDGDPVDLGPRFDPPSTSRRKQRGCIYRVVYRSRLIYNASIQEIIKVSNRKNKRRKIGGTLWYDPHTRQIRQVLEGPYHTVNALLKKIAEDKRHLAFEIELEQFPLERYFSRWTGMTFTTDENFALLNIPDGDVPARSYFSTFLEIGEYNRIAEVLFGGTVDQYIGGVLMYDEESKEAELFLEGPCDSLKAQISVLHSISKNITEKHGEPSAPRNTPMTEIQKDMPKSTVVTPASTTPAHSRDYSMQNNSTNIPSQIRGGAEIKTISSSNTTDNKHQFRENRIRQNLRLSIPDDNTQRISVFTPDQACRADYKTISTLSPPRTNKTFTKENILLSSIEAMAEMSIASENADVKNDLYTPKGTRENNVKRVSGPLYESLSSLARSSSNERLFHVSSSNLISTACSNNPGKYKTHLPEWDCDCFVTSTVDATTGILFSVWHFQSRRRKIRGLGVKKVGLSLPMLGTLDTLVSEVQKQVSLQLLTARPLSKNDHKNFLSPPTATQRLRNSAELLDSEKAVTPEMEIPKRLKKVETKSSGYYEDGEAEFTDHYTAEDDEDLANYVAAKKNRNKMFERYRVEWTTHDFQKQFLGFRLEAADPIDKLACNQKFAFVCIPTSNTGRSRTVLILVRTIAIIH